MREYPKYTWAVNETKIARAVMTINDRIKAGVKIDNFDEAVKAEYIKLAGLVHEVDEVKEISLEDMTVKELKKLAIDKDINVTGMKKDDIIAALTEDDK
jgi:hypothetical protein